MGLLSGTNKKPSILKRVSRGLSRAYFYAASTFSGPLDLKRRRSFIS